MGRPLKAVVRGFARRQKHESNALLKLLTPELKECVDNIVTLTKDKDAKIALAANQFILKLHGDLAAAINTDEMHRLIANAKFGGPRELELEDDTPDVDFGSIQEIE